MQRIIRATVPLVAAIGVFVFARPASAQDVETGPMRAAPAFSAPEAGRGGPDASRPTGAAPAPERPGPIGEPAPPAAAPLAAGVIDEDGSAPVAALSAAADAAAADAAAASGPVAEEGGLLGSPVPAPVRNSFLPAARISPSRGPVSVLGSAWGGSGRAFVDDQLTYPRVVNAQLDAKFDLKALFTERGLTYPPRDLYFRLFKQEEVLEVWVRDTPTSETYTLLREYPICAVPGRLGPKTRVDDFQAPEGFYYIQGFNPRSEFHLSLRLNYPNAADRIIGVTEGLGGDIYIHGGCTTVGCFPMTDDAMRELYWLAVEARGAGQTIIPVHVFPARLDQGAMRWLSETFRRDHELVAFWENLREGYAYFEEHRRLPVISVDGRGRYLFADPPPPAPIQVGTIRDSGLLGSPAETTPIVPAAEAAEDAALEAEVVDENVAPAAEVPSTDAPPAADPAIETDRALGASLDAVPAAPADAEEDAVVEDAVVEDAAAEAPLPVGTLR